MSEQPLHDWLRPRLETLIREAEATGFGHVATIAVIGDLVMDPSFNMAPLPQESASAPVAVEASAIEPDFVGPSVGSTEWIKPYGSA